MLVSFQQQLGSKQRDHWDLNPRFDSNRHVPPEQSIHRKLESVPKSFALQNSSSQRTKFNGGSGDITHVLAGSVALHRMGPS